MKMKLSHQLAGLVIAASCSVVSAAPVEVAAFAPSLVNFDGEGGDDQSLLLSSFFSAGAYTGYKVTSIEWWGGYLLPAQSNAFTVTFNGRSVVTEATVTQVLVDELLTPPVPNEPQQEVPLYRYSVDTSALSLLIQDLASTNDDNELMVLSTLSEVGSNWFWQYSEVGSSQLAYRIMGEAVTQVPEPSSAWLVALAGLGLAASRRRQA